MRTFSAILASAAALSTVAPSAADTLAATASSPGARVLEPAQRYETPGRAPVNSWWLPTPDGGLVVFDALRSFTDAHAAVAVIRATGRPVRAIFITHPHPDHLTGLPIYRAEFPDAKVYSSGAAEKFEQGRGKALLDMNVKSHAAGDATAEIPHADVLLAGGEELEIGGLQIQVRSLGSGESPAATAYFIPALRTLVLGDVLTPRRQPLLAAGSTGSWLHQIGQVRAAFEPTIRVLPGHGPETTLAPAADWQQAYLQHYRQDVGAALKAATARGHCIGAARAKAIQVDMDRAFPVDEQVAQIPADVLAGLNLDGVAWELKGRVCKPVDNPIRGR